MAEPERFHVEDKTSPWESRILRTLNTFAIDVMSIPNVDDLFWYVAQNVVGRLGLVDCVIYQANESQTELTQVAAWGEKNPFGRNIINPLVIPFGRGITGKVAQTKKPVIIDDLLSDPHYIFDTQPARSEICVPLILRGRVLGVIDSEHPQPKMFSDAELEVLTTVAAMTSAKLALLAETQRSIQRYNDVVASHAQLTTETNNRKALETELFEARKLEAVGRLTGRFAHEFNNLLTVVSGNLDLIEVDSTDVLNLASLHDARSAAVRGAGMIRDMLAFSQRSRLETKTVDLNAFVMSMFELGLQVETVSVSLALDPDIWLAKVDPKALQTALLNVVTNAKEAMPDTGTIEIKTQNILHVAQEDATLVTKLQAGRYVCVSVTDSGTGISRERVRQIFDPFYTTKSVGRGTGLGLSYVVGLMQQSGGGLAVNSDVGKGSTFRMFIPAVESSINSLLTSSI